MNSKEIGYIGEKAAKEYLESKGYNILCTNYYSRYGEIDIISQFNKYIIFVEVKTRKPNSYCLPIQAVDIKKQTRIINTALNYIVENNIDLQPRFDVIEIIRDKKIISINHIINAFESVDSNAFF